MADKQQQDKKLRKDAKAKYLRSRQEAGDKARYSRRLRDQFTTIEALKAEIKLLTSYASDVIYRLRYDSMKYDYISPTIQKMIGFTPAELEKVGLRSLIVETRIVAEGMRMVESFAPLEETRKQGEVNKWHADYLMKRKDGSQVWVSDISYPWFDESGAIIGSIGSLRDITERVEAEQQVRQELVRLHNSDSLTGLANRRVFFSRMEEEVKRFKRARSDLAVALIDIDQFKKINDAYGNAVGDTVLVGVTKIIQSCLRETDVAARIGGEEFGILLPDTPIEGAYWVAERIRSTVAKQVFFANDDPNRPLGCTVSIGVAAARYDEEADAGRLYKVADTRLYIAKHTGRNQVSKDELVQLH